MEQSLAVFLLVRAELEILSILPELLCELCRYSSPLERKSPRDPLTSIPVRQDLSSPLRRLEACFEETDLQRLTRCLEDAIGLMNRFRVDS